jgi:putative tryptophan/tyrosine transport system substrate-binding protein
MIDRRAFVTGSVAALAAPRTAVAQQARKVYRIGFLGGGIPSGYAPHVEALRLGLRDHGYVEGRNVTLEFRWAEGKYDRLPTLVDELIRLNVDIIVTQGTPAALVAKNATTTIPIVMTIVGNPEQSGVVPSLARPGGNITGSSFFMADLNAKRLEILKTALPRLARAAVLTNPGNAAMVAVLKAMDERASALKLRLWNIEVRRLDELDTAFTAAKARAEALVVVDEGLYISNASRIAELALKHRLPSIGFTEYGEAGGLLAYGVNFPHVWRQSMSLVDKILKGKKPAELPILQATRFDVVVNSKTAKALGVTIPPSLLLRADQVIE